MESFQKHFSKRQVWGGQKHRASRLYAMVCYETGGSPHSWKDLGLLPPIKLQGGGATLELIIHFFLNLSKTEDAC